jgi:hypothetical protein
VWCAGKRTGDGVEWVGQLDPQVVEGDVGGGVEPGCDPDGFCPVDLEPRARHGLIVRLVRPGYAVERGFGEGSSNGVWSRWSRKPLQAGPGDLRPVDDDVTRGRVGRDMRMMFRPTRSWPYSRWLTGLASTTVQCRSTTSAG